MLQNVLCALVVSLCVGSTACLQGGVPVNEPAAETPLGTPTSPDEATEDAPADMPDPAVEDEVVEPPEEDTVWDPPQDDPPEDELPVEPAPDAPTHELAPRLVLDERIELADFKRPIRPSLAVDPQGRPHFYLTLWRDHRDHAGYLVRGEHGWEHVAIVSGPSAGIGHGAGMAYGFVDWTAEHGLEAWIWRDADGTVAHDNRTDLFRLVDGAWRVIASVDSTEVYQILRDLDGAVVAALGHYGGNNYFLEPDGDGWLRSFFPAFSNRPLGVLTPEGTVAALSRLQLVHFGGSTELIDHAERELPAFGPVVTTDGSIHVLRRNSAHDDNRLTLSTRTEPHRWSHELLAIDPEVPPATDCPEEIGIACAHPIERVFAAGIVAAGDTVIPLTVRQEHVAAYERECLQYDPDYHGSTLGPCLDDNGPAGPWLETPGLRPSGDPRLEIAGVEVALEEPLSRDVRLATHADLDGHLHIAYLDQEHLRYLLIDLAGAP